MPTLPYHSFIFLYFFLLCAILSGFSFCIFSSYAAKFPWNHFVWPLPSKIRRWVHILSRKNRSWLITIAQPWKSIMACSSTRIVFTSRSFVGSSSRRRFPPLLSIFARWILFLSPPEHSETIFCCCEPRKLNLATYARAFTEVPPTSTVSLPSVISSKMFFFASSSSRCWSTYPMETDGPISIVPESGSFCFVIILKRVVLPIPFGPITPTIALGGSSNEHLSMRRLSSKPFDMSWKERTLSPRGFPVGMCISTSWRESSVVWAERFS